MELKKETRKLKIKLRLHEKDTIVSGAISKDDKFLIINTSYKNPEIHLWSL